jgi:glycosyltransferase involved in cell wall biosynthesis
LKDRISITIGIPVYNESNNITHLLDDIERSQASLNPHFYISEVLVADGSSTDGTVDKVQQWQQEHKQVKVQVFRRHFRVGKPQDLNLIFSTATTELLVCLDGDVRLLENSLANLLSNFYRVPQPDVVWGGDLPSRRDPHYWAGAFLLDMWRRTRTRLPSDFAVAAGYFFAVSRKFYSSFRFSEGKIADDITLASYVTVNRIRTYQDPRAIVLVTPVGSFRDYYLQTYRHRAAIRIIKTTAHYPRLPRGLGMRMLLEQAITDPRGALLYLLYRLGCIVQHATRPEIFSECWPIASTTKLNT